MSPPDPSEVSETDMAGGRASRQDEVHAFIVRHVRENGYAPSIREICAALGLRSTSTVHYHLTALARRGIIQWEGGKNRAIKLLAGLPGEAPEARLVPKGLPIVGRIAAGRPIEAIAEADEYLDLDACFNGPELFVLRVKGDSMIEDHIADGDYVIIKRQETARDGEIVVALLDDGEATLKRLYREPGGRFRLQPANCAMAPLYVDRVRVQGKVVGLLRAQF
ncbi:MAG: transcriptional repressor LexA [Candidatus Sericytochromatia bacterium]|nr:transcriptional repressor LexA [Candidatus Sericytochromatia bacterium]